jgi:hypothetical protein
VQQHEKYQQQSYPLFSGGSGGTISGANPAKSDEANEIYASVFEEKELSIHSIHLEFSPGIKLSSIINAEDSDEDPLHWTFTRTKSA